MEQAFVEALYAGSGEENEPTNVAIETIVAAITTNRARSRSAPGETDGSFWSGRKKKTIQLRVVLFLLSDERAFATTLLVPEAAPASG